MRATRAHDRQRLFSRVMRGALRRLGVAFTLASTTSTEQSGLFSYLLPAFRQATGIDVKVVAVGTGQAVDMARRGDADALLVHDRQAELKLVADGFALRRVSVMHNDFVLIGRAADPAGVKGRDIVAALQKVAASRAPFISRGDKSGTYAAELRFLELGSLRPENVAGLRSCGCGMGSALNMASSTGAYVLADRGTWLSFRNRGDLAILVEGDARLMNSYGALVVNSAMHPHVKSAAAQKFVDWLVSPAGQARIASYRIGGEQLFFPDVR